jgi:hypothetical protein
MASDGSNIHLAHDVDSMLSAINLDAIRSDDLRELLVQTDVAIRQMQAMQGTAMLAMVDESWPANAGRVTVGGDSLGVDREPEEFVVDEIAVLLSCTRAAANLKLSTARQSRRHRALGTAWRAGAIEATKVRLIAEGVYPLTARDVAIPETVDDATVDSLITDATTYAMTPTTGQVRAWLARRVITVDPDAADVRRCRAMHERRVIITPRGDGMSELWALLPSVAARQIQQVLTRQAHDAARDAESGDSRTADGRRADAVCEGLLGSAPPSVDITLILTGALDADGRLQVNPTGHVDGLGAITTGEIMELLGSKASAGPNGDTRRPRIVPCDPITGTVIVSQRVETAYRPSANLAELVRARDVTCRFPGCRRAATGTASGVDLDHTVPWPSGATVASNLACLFRRHHRLKHAGLWRVELEPNGAISWTGPTGRIYRTEPWHYTDSGPP